MVEWKKLGDVCKDVIVPMRDRPKVFDGTTPWCRIEDIEGMYFNKSLSGLMVSDSVIKQMNLKVFPTGTVICSCSATLGVCAINTQPLITNQTFIGLVCSNQVNNRYLYYYMLTRKKELFSLSTTGTIPYVSRDKFEKMIIPIPSISEQERIVSILDTFTSSIDNLKQQIAQRRKQYEYYRDQLLDLEGKDIEEILSFGNDFQLKARIGWQGLTKKEYKETGDYKLVTGTDFTSNLRIDFDNCVYVDKERYEQDEYIQLKVGDVLITKDGTLGKVAYIDILEKPATLNGGVFVVRDPKNRVLPKFLMFYLTSYHFKKWMQQNHTTGSIQHLTQKLLSSFTIPVFSLEEQQRIVSILDAFEASIQILEAQLSQREKQYEYYRNKLLTFE